MSQTTQSNNQAFYDQQMQLHQELHEAIKSGDKQKADQYRAQLNSLFKQEFVQRKLLSDALRSATKSGDRQKVQQLRDQLNGQLEDMMPWRMKHHKRTGMTIDPQLVILHQELHDAMKSGDKQKAGQLRAQLILWLKQRHSQRQQLMSAIQEAIKTGDKQKVEQLREQMMSMNP